MYMVDYEGTMPIFAYAYLTHDRRWTGPRAYRITIYQDDTLMCWTPISSILCRERRQS